MGGILKIKRSKEIKMEIPIKRGRCRKGLHGSNREDFCNKKWRASYQKKNGGLSGAAARTGSLK